MRSSNTQGLGCNILVLHEVDYYSDNANYAEKIKKKVKNTYANVIALNIIEPYEEKVLKVLKEFPVMSKTIIRSSMGNYNTVFYILDCSFIPKDYSYRRSHPDFEALDRE